MQFGLSHRAFWAHTLSLLSIVCWVVMPCASAFDWGEEEVVWFIADSDDERSEENKQGEEEAADDELKKWSDLAERKAETMAMHELNLSSTANRAWDSPYRRGVFEPPEMKA
ncbi:MAG: hypothetical protein CL828_09845 [Crocinitomicaceae bacterium]|nr:hypothetical protein [Crocinitomicaceae bacterium]